METEYPAGTPDKYKPVADELRRIGYAVDEFRVRDYGHTMQFAISRDGSRFLSILHGECENVVFDVLETQWWKSVLERQKASAELAHDFPSTFGHVANPEYRAEQEQKNNSARSMMDAVADKRMDEAELRVSGLRKASDAEAQAQINARCELLKKQKVEFATKEMWRYHPEAKNGIEAVTEIHDVPLGSKRIQTVDLHEPRWTDGQEVIDDGEIHAVCVGRFIEIWDSDHIVLYGKVGAYLLIDDVHAAATMYFNGLNRGKEQGERVAQQHMREAMGIFP